MLIVADFGDFVQHGDAGVGCIFEHVGLNGKKWLEKGEEGISVNF